MKADFQFNKLRDTLLSHTLLTFFVHVAKVSHPQILFDVHISHTFFVSDIYDYNQRLHVFVVFITIYKRSLEQLLSRDLLQMFQ